MNFWSVLFTFQTAPDIGAILGEEFDLRVREELGQAPLERLELHHIEGF